MHVWSPVVCVCDYVCTVNICIEQCSNIWFFDREQSIEKGQDNSIENVMYFTFLPSASAGSRLSDHRRWFALFVCLFALRIHGPKGFHRMVRLGRKWYKEWLGQTWRCCGSLWMQDFFVREGLGMVAGEVVHDWRNGLMDFILVGKI